ncbi:MAG: hypothetical protein J6X53_03545, partial [Abditibacteriota bacterium]|nr:hypothetical protein [Abditibacteriota bacterium]
TAADHRDGTGTVTPNAASTTCNITMTATCVVGGKVTDGYGPVSGAQIYLGGSLKATADGNGDYSFTVDKSDTAMTLTAKADDHRDGTASATPNAGSVTCDITLTATCVVKGTVTSALDGEPVVGALVTVGGETDTTDEYGGYRITADRAPGAEINVTAEGYAPYSGTVFTDDTGVMKDVVLEPAGTVITDAEELKAAEVGEYVDVVFDAKAMNGSFDFNDGSVYIEAGLFTGYKVIIPDGVLTVKGDVFTFRGQVESDGDGKYVRATSIKPVSTGNPVRTLGMTNHILTSNALVRVWGRVASVGEGSFILRNAYGDITVKIEAADAPDEGNFAVVTGIAGPNGIRAIEIIN